MKITSSITIALAICGSLGSIPTGINAIKYDLLGMARNEPEVYTRHMIADHLVSIEEPQATVIYRPNEFISVNVFPDGCVVVKRKTTDGMVTSNTVVPDPKMVDKIKELYSGSDNNIAYAMEPPFDFGAHKADYGYDESKKGSSVLRVYKDGCVLRYEFNKYGTSQRWQWIKYNHQK